MQPSGPSSSQEALSQLQQAQSQAQNPNDILSSQRQQLGVNAAQDTATGLRGAINNTTKLLQQVAPSVMGRTQNSLVTDAQANRQIANEQAPISQNLNTQTNQYNQANQDLATLSQRAADAAQGIYQGQQDKNSYLQNLYSTLYGREQDARTAAQQEADRAEQARQFNAKLAADQASAKASAGGFNFGFGDTAAAQTAAGQANGATGDSRSAQQLAFDDVYTRINRDDPNAIKSDYLATVNSARRGNLTDQYKVQFYEQLRPDIFNGIVGVNSLPIANQAQLRY